MIISDQILLFAFQCNASDIHIIQGEEPTYRIDGQIRRLSQINESENINTQCHNGKLNDQIIQEVLDNCGISNKYLDEKKNIDFAYSVNNKRFRVNVYFERSRMAAAFRALPENMPSIENLYSDPNLATTLYKLANLPNGLVLVNGPTGSGKSSTLAAIINYINQNHPKSIITIEDPIEYLHHPINSIISQREIGRDVLSFSDGLRAALRQDPDIILVGEMRDQETIRTALHAAKTGHLVFSTLHTGSASETIDRIISMFPGDEQSSIRTDLSDALKGIVAQHLVRKISGGRTPAVEIMVVTSSIRALIREGKTHQIPTAIQTGKNEGMILMQKSLSSMISQGIIEKEEVLKYTSEQNLEQYQ
jgi:twitching motility protein PilT